MKKKNINIILLLVFLVFKINISFAEVVKKIEILGNERISSETIILFSQVSIDDNLNKNDLNKILKNLYETNFFDDVTVKLENDLLLINVLESPIIENIEYKGIKANKILDVLKENSLIKNRSSFNKILIKEEKKRLQFLLNELGYYNGSVEVYVVKNTNNLVNLTLDFKLGDKAKLKKITFIGDKIFKDRKLRRIIASSEYKHWKFLTGRKFLNRNLVDLDNRLLSNFYKNNGYYNVKINTTFAKILKDNEFELIFNIDVNGFILTNSH